MSLVVALYMGVISLLSLLGVAFISIMIVPVLKVTVLLYNTVSVD